MCNKLNKYEELVHHWSREGGWEFWCEIIDEMESVVKKYVKYNVE